MFAEHVKNWRLEIKLGLIGGLLSLLWMVFEKLLGLHDRYIEYHSYVTMCAIVIPIAMLIYAMKAKQERLGGILKWSDGFLTGLKVKAVTALLAPLSIILFYRVINPQWQHNAVEAAQKHAISKGMSPQEVQKVTEAAKIYFSEASYMVQATAGSLILGVILSMVIALVLRHTDAKE